MTKLISGLVLALLACVCWAQNVDNPNMHKETRIRVGRVCWAEVSKEVTPSSVLIKINEDQNVQLTYGENKSIKTKSIANFSVLRVSMVYQEGRTLSPVDFYVEWKGRIYRSVAVVQDNQLSIATQILKASPNRIYSYFFVVPDPGNVTECFYDLVWALDSKNSPLSRVRIDAVNLGNQPFTPIATLKDYKNAFIKKLIGGDRMQLATIQIGVGFNKGNGTEILSYSDKKLGDGTAKIVPNGILGGALQLNGGYSTLDPYVFQYGYSTQGSNFALSVWIKPNPIKEGVIFAQGDIEKAKNAIALSTTQKGLRFQLNCNGEKIILNAYLKQNEWQLVTVSVNKSSVKLYVNDKLQAEAKRENPLFKMDGDVVLGRSSDLASSSSFQGLIDELRLYDNEISQAEISERIKKKE